MRLTDERDRERQFTLVATRKLTGQPVCVHVQRGRDHERLDVGAQFRSRPESLEATINQQVLSDGQLNVDGRKLWADAKREAGIPGGIDDGDAFDLDIPYIGDDITAFKLCESSVGTIDKRK